MLYDVFTDIKNSLLKVESCITRDKCSTYYISNACVYIRTSTVEDINRYEEYKLYKNNSDDLLNLKKFESVLPEKLFKQGSIQLPEVISKGEIGDPILVPAVFNNSTYLWVLSAINKSKDLKLVEETIDKDNILSYSAIKAYKIQSSILSCVKKDTTLKVVFKVTTGGWLATFITKEYDNGVDYLYAPMISLNRDSTLSSILHPDGTIYAGIGWNPNTKRYKSIEKIKKVKELEMKTTLPNPFKDSKINLSSVIKNMEELSKEKDSNIEKEETHEKVTVINDSQDIKEDTINKEETNNADEVDNNVDVTCNMNTIPSEEPTKTRKTRKKKEAKDSISILICFTDIINKLSDAANLPLPTDTQDVMQELRAIRDLQILLSRRAANIALDRISSYKDTATKLEALSQILNS